MTDTDDRPMKALYDHCITVFDEMFKEAEPEVDISIADVNEGEAPSGYMIWTGHTTQLFARLGMATPYYTTVMQALKKMSCVEQVKRGGGNSMSKWRLVRRPEEEFFEAAEKLKKPIQGGQKALEQQMRDLNNRLNNVETTLHDLVQSLPVMENVE